MSMSSRVLEYPDQQSMLVSVSLVCDSATLGYPLPQTPWRELTPAEPS